LDEGEKIGYEKRRWQEKPQDCFQGRNLVLAVLRLWILRKESGFRTFIKKSMNGICTVTAMCALQRGIAKENSVYMTAFCRVGYQL
jgi:hypothetical protein